VIPDARHGAPYSAKWIDNTTQIALSTMTTFSNTPVTITNTPISTGSLAFAGSALVFHKTDRIQFTVTYTVDALAKPMTQK
jgi:ribosomal protein S11